MNAASIAAGVRYEMSDKAVLFQSCKTFRHFISERLNVDKVNISTDLLPLLMEFFAIDCPPSFFRQRFCFMVIVINTLTDIHDIAIVKKVMEVYLSCFSHCLRSRGPEYFDEVMATTFYCDNLRDDSLRIIARTRPRNNAENIRAFYNLHDERNPEFNVFISEIYKVLEVDALPALEWVNALQLEKFKKDNILLVYAAIRRRNLDVKTILFTERRWVELLVSTLDRTMGWTNFNMSSPLVSQFFHDTNRRSRAEIVSRFSREYNLDRRKLCPNTVRMRTAADFLYQYCKLGDQTATELARDQLLASAESIKDVMNLLRQVYRRDVITALALAESIDLDRSDILKLHSEYKSMPESMRFEIDQKKLIICDYQGTTNKIDCLKHKERQIYLVDTEERLRVVETELTVNNMVSFDVEANYVCQNDDSIPKAVLLQMCFCQRVYLVDFLVLKSALSSERLHHFFTLFFRPNIKRIAFDVKSDLDFLRRGFVEVEDILQHEDVNFFCVQTLVHKILSEAPLSCLFPKLHSVSLKEILRSWIDITSMSKEEQCSNWEARPLRPAQMKYAAFDAIGTAACFFAIQEKLRENDVEGVMQFGYVSSHTIEAVRASSSVDVVQESRAEELSRVRNTCEYLRQTATTRNSRDIAILVDSPFLGVVYLLRQLGFRVWDYRDTDRNPALTRIEMSRLLLGQIEKEISKRSTYYVLINAKVKKEINQSAKLPDERFIVSRHTNARSEIVCEVIKGTKAYVDVDDAMKKCVNCAEDTDHVTVAVEVFRVLYAHFALMKGFAHKMNIFDENLKAMCIEMVKKHRNVVMHRDVLTTQVNDVQLQFIVKDLRVIILQAGVESPPKAYRVDSRVYNSLEDREDVKFCRQCGNFF